MLDNKNIQKVFGLSDYRKQALAGKIPERTREAFREYGYFGGGLPGPRSTVDRIDYSNDTATASVRGSLSSVRTSLAATGNSNFGYFGGGFATSVVSVVDRIDYSNDSATASVRGPLSLARFALSATGNSNFGYFGGGGVPGTVSTVDRIDYSNDSATASVRGPLGLARYGIGASGNSNFGYYAGGRLTPSEGGSRKSTIDRINYSNDTSTASSRSPLTEAKDGVGASGNSNFGYFAGGTSAYTSRIERLDYANDLIAPTIRGPLSAGKSYCAATGNSNFGYYGKGTSPAVLPGAFSTTERIDYSNDTQTTSIRGSGAFFSFYTAASSSHSFGGSPNSSYASNFTFPTVPNAGYFGGGFDGTNYLASIHKVDYANDTATASVRSALSSARSDLAATGNSNFGYFGSGWAPGDVSTVDRIEYSSDTQNTIVRGPLSLTRSQVSATGNSNFGYFAGGGGPTSRVDRIDYTNDTATASVRGPLSLAKRFFATIGNSNFGYGCGGWDGANISRVDRIDYYNDNSTALVRGPLQSVSSHVSGGSGNTNFGYVFCGILGALISTINRIDYSNDTQIASLRGPLNTSSQYNSMTGSSNFGYVGGGPISTTIDRINFSNDTAVASIRGPLSTIKSSLAATSPLAYGGAPIYFTNPLPEVFQKQIEFDDSNTLDLPFKRVLGSYGYWIGGNFPTTTTTCRIDYSNDTVTAPVRGNIALGVLYSHAAGNSNYGYNAGGWTQSLEFDGITNVNRIDYSNDLATSIVRGSLNQSNRMHSGVSNDNYAYFSAGYVGLSKVSRIDFSNDSSNSLSRGKTNLNRLQTAATGNSNFGYFGGGASIPGSTDYSQIDRIDYLNDSVNASVRGPLSSARRYLAATGNSNFGYFGGGGFVVSTVDRIDYSNDTVTASVRGPLSVVRNKLSATGNSNFGYFGGSLSETTSIDRIDYSNDTATASVRGPLSASKPYSTASTNARNS